MKLNDVSLQAILANLIELGNLFDPLACFIGVAQAINDQGGDTDLADVTQATGAMATRVAVVAWSAAHKRDDGSWSVESNLASFTPADETQAQIITDYFIASLAAAGALKAWGSLGRQVVLPSEFYSVRVMVELRVDPSGQWGTAILIDG